MKRAIKVSIAALAFVFALGVGLVAPSGADNELVINAGGNNCGVLVNAGNNLNGDNGNLGSCYYIAAPDLDSWIYAETLTGVDTTTSTLYCNDPARLAPIVTVTDPAGGTFTKATLPNG